MKTKKAKEDKEVLFKNLIKQLELGLEEEKKKEGYESFSNIMKGEYPQFPFFDTFNKFTPVGNDCFLNQRKELFSLEVDKLTGKRKLVKHEIKF